MMMSITEELVQIHNSIDLLHFFANVNILFENNAVAVIDLWYL